MKTKQRHIADISLRLALSRSATSDGPFSSVDSPHVPSAPQSPTFEVWELGSAQLVRAFTRLEVTTNMSLLNFESPSEDGKRLNGGVPSRGTCALC